MRVVNAYTIRPEEIQPEDVALFVVKIMVVRPGIFRIYRCAFQGKEVPEGARIDHEGAVADALFPSFARLARPDSF